MQIDSDVTGHYCADARACKAIDYSGGAVAQATHRGVFACNCA